MEIAIAAFLSAVISKIIVTMVITAVLTVKMQLTGVSQGFVVAERV